MRSETTNTGLALDLAQWRTEATPASERDMLGTLLDSQPDAIFFKDLQCRFVRVNKVKLESTFELAQAHHHRMPQGNGSGRLPEQLTSLERFALYLPGKTELDFDDGARARAAFEEEQEVIRSGKPIVGKAEKRVLPDGRTAWWQTTKRPWYDAKGRVIGTFGRSREITDIKEAEERLEATRRELAAASRQAGMAEVATSVLHNVGNVLTSVKVSSGLVNDLAKRSRISTLARATHLISEHADDLGTYLTSDPKGRQLPGYLIQLAEHLTTEQGQLVKELDALKRNLDHIEEIVTLQQNYAKTIGVREVVKAEDLVEDALRMNAGALVRHQVQLTREYDPHLPVITVERNKVLQILVNLVRNAKYACDESGRSDKRLTVRVSSDDGWVRITVQDNGVGIPAENLGRIFSYGFTTRKNGHGYGLHSGMLAAREMGGRIRAQSDGVGQGAAFTLELPLSAK